MRLLFGDDVSKRLLPQWAMYDGVPAVRDLHGRTVRGEGLWGLRTMQRERQLRVDLCPLRGVFRRTVRRENVRGM